MEHEGTEVLLNTLTAMVIASYCYGIIDANNSWDQSVQVTKLIRTLKQRDVSLKDIELSIIKNDFTGMLTHVGSGDRERGFVMDYIEEIYYEE